MPAMPSPGVVLPRFVRASVTEYASFTLSCDGAIVTWNSEAERTFGYTSDDVLGRNFAVIFPLDDVANGIPAGELNAAVTHGRVHRDGWHVRKDGSRFWGTNTVEPLFDRAGRRIGYTKTVRDKSRGRARTAIFDDARRARAGAPRLLEADLRRAIADDDLFLEYQPIVVLDDLRLAGFEALVRWRHPVRGRLAPVDFIPMAEETGLIVAMDRWVLSAACRQLRAWQDDFPTAAPLTVSVNMSAQQFVHDDVCRVIARSLAKSRVRPASLKLEITESSILETSKRVSSLLTAIRDLDVDIHIDDFGTGYSALSYLRAFPVSAVKVDRSFVTGMKSDDDRAHMVRAIVALAHNLGLTVVAEGIETPEELETLRALSCEYGQGFLFSSPVGAEAARELVEKSCKAAVSR
jgi:PAS domain S-box-containing protein